jgi:DNA polymerase-3 subunit alpha
MKANYPVEYMAALLTADAGDTEQIAIFVAECARLGIRVLPPDVNESGSMFTVVEDDAIRFGLSSIKNFGEGISEAIMENRKSGGPFTSLTEFLTRIESRNLNRKSLESLAKCGALDRFADRATLLANVEHLLEFHRETSRDIGTQDSLFGIQTAPHTLTLKEAGEATLLEKLEWERELLGIYVSGHPLDAYHDRLKNKEQTLHKFLSDGRNGLPVVAPVLVEEVKTILTKGGDKMAFVRIADKETTIESVLFPRLFKEKGALFTPGTCIIIKGKMSSRNGETSILIEDAKPL